MTALLSGVIVGGYKIHIPARGIGVLGLVSWHDRNHLAITVDLVPGQIRLTV